MNSATTVRLRPTGTVTGKELLERTGAVMETAFFVFGISIFIGAYTGLPSRLSGTTIEIGASDPTNTAANIIILAGLCLLSLIHWRKFLSVVAKGLLVNLFTLLAITSTFWSMAPDVTLRRVLTFLLTVCLGYLMVARLPLERIIRLLAFSIVLAAIASAVFAITNPDVGIMHEETLVGDWCGVFAHKNLLGAVMMLGCLCCGWLMLHEPQRRKLYGLGVLICFALAVLSGSRTSVVMTLLFPVFGCCLLALRAQGILRIWLVYGLILASTIISVIIYTNFDALMLLLDKDPSLSGRVPLWELLLTDSFAYRPILGYGYGAFWLKYNIDVMYIWHVLQWPAPEAHNSYLDSLLELGIPGLTTACAMLGSVIGRSLSGVWRGSPSWASFAALYAIGLTITGFDETSLLRSGDMSSMILPMLYVSLRLQHYLPPLERLRSFETNDKI